VSATPIAAAASAVAARPRRASGQGGERQRGHGQQDRGAARGPQAGPVRHGEDRRRDHDKRAAGRQQQAGHRAA